MTDRPRATKHSKVGSNVKAHKRLASANAALLERRFKPFRRAERQLQRQQRDILTKPVARKVAEIVRQHSAAYNQAFVNAGGNGVKIIKARERARSAIDRALRASVPGFAKHEALLQQHERDHQGLVANHLLIPQNLALDFALGDILLPGGAGFKVFRPPFELFDVTPAELRSFAEPRSGIVMTEASHQHFSPRHLPIISIPFNPSRNGDNRSSVGINFRVPQTGFLTFVALIQNLFAKFEFTALDNFGFSSADLDVVHSIFVAIIRSGQVIRFETIVFANGLVAHGDDLSFSIVPILDSAPFTIGFKHKDAFLKGEQIQILAGEAVETHTKVDDMDGFIHSLAAWQVKRISVGFSPELILG
jgi:hypothetical protein